MLQDFGFSAGPKMPKKLSKQPQHLLPLYVVIGDLCSRLLLPKLLFLVFLQTAVQSLAAKPHPAHEASTMVSTWTITPGLGKVPLRPLGWELFFKRESSTNKVTEPGRCLRPKGGMFQTCSKSHMYLQCKSYTGPPPPKKEHHCSEQGSSQNLQTKKREILPFYTALLSLLPASATNTSQNYEEAL